MTTLATAPKSEMLQRAITDQRAEIATQRRRHATLIGQLAAKPDDQALLGELTGVATAMAGASASIDSLEEALESAQAAEEQAAIAAAREAVAGVRADVLKALADRLPLAQKIDTQAAALAESLRELRDAGRVLAGNAKTVIRARYGSAASTTFIDEASLILPPAAARSTPFKLALAETVKQLVAAVGPIDDYVVVNDFVETGGFTFASAAASAAAYLETRL